MRQFIILALKNLFLNTQEIFLLFIKNYQTMIKIFQKFDHLFFTIHLS